MGQWKVGRRGAGEGGGKGKEGGRSLSYWFTLQVATMAVIGPD